MDFNLTGEQLDIQRAAEESAKGEFDPDAALQYDMDQQFPSALRRKASELGFVGIHIPEEYAGQGLGLLENVLVVEASMVKYWTTDTAMRVADGCMELYGNDGICEDYPIARVWRDTGVMAIFAGTNEIMKGIAAKFMGL